jgi:chemotaxis family two-component system response regulator Rcp1
LESGIARQFIFLHGVIAMSTPLSSERPVEILLVEDNPADIELTRQGFKEGRIVNNLHVVRDGVEAIDFLRRREAYADVPRPDFILLDLNLPRKSGREVLDEIKADDQLKQIPVVILTTSQADEDINKAYSLAANAYMNKPVGFDRFVTLVKGISDYWFSMVRLPAP